MRRALDSALLALEFLTVLRTAGVALSRNEEQPD
jgi:hypothetical protein